MKQDPGECSNPPVPNPWQRDCDAGAPAACKDEGEVLGLSAVAIHRVPPRSASHVVNRQEIYRNAQPPRDALGLLALDRANRVRAARATLKRRLRRGDIAAAEVLRSRSRDTGTMTGAR
jgi:hypothetical protein